MPGKKMPYRLYSNDGHALIDLLQRPDEEPPEVNKRVLCRHPFQVRNSISRKNFDQILFFAISKMSKNEFLNWEKSLKLPKMQFHEIFCLDFLKFSGPL